MFREEEVFLRIVKFVRFLYVFINFIKRKLFLDIVLIFVGYFINVLLVMYKRMWMVFVIFFKNYGGNSDYVYLLNNVNN